MTVVLPGTHVPARERKCPANDPKYTHEVAHDFPVPGQIVITIMSSENDRDDLRDDEDDEYRASDNHLDVSSRLPSSSVLVPPRQKRGRKAHPNPPVSSAREAARRANHSIIEKVRREKINHALSELSKLVPPQPDERSVAMGSATNDAITVNTTKVQPKEYKLEVLVRTVGYLRHLIDRVETLERLTSEQSVQDGTRSYQQNIPLDSKPSDGPCMPEPALCTNCAHPLRLSNPHIPSPRFPPSSEANPPYQQRLPSLASILNPSQPLNQQLLPPPGSDSLSTSHRGSTSIYFPPHPSSLRLPSSGLSPPRHMPTRLDTSALPQAGSHLSSMTPSLVSFPSTETLYVPASSSGAKRNPVFPPLPLQQRREHSHDDDVAISTLMTMSGSYHSSASYAGQPSPLEGREQYSNTSTGANSGGTSTPNTSIPGSSVPPTPSRGLGSSTLAYRPTGGHTEGGGPIMRGYRGQVHDGSLPAAREKGRFADMAERGADRWALLPFITPP